MLTDRGDLVLDPFAGSCTTGAISEWMEREWICIEQEEDYLAGSLGHFKGMPYQSKMSSSITINKPVYVSDDDVKIGSSNASQ